MPLSLIELTSLIICILLAGMDYSRRKIQLPPGPMGLPVVGNLLDMPTHEQWQTFSDWGRKYGDLVYLKVFQTSFLFLNTADASRELLEKRSQIYSDRPNLEMACNLCGMGRLSPLTPFGARFRLERKLMNQALSIRAVDRWTPLIEAETNILLRNILTKPDKFVPHLWRMAGSIIFQAIYGYKVTSDDDPYVSAAEEFMRVNTYIITAGWVVDFVPFLKYLPQWIPGAQFQQVARELRLKMAEWVDKPYELFKDITASKTVDTSFCASLLHPEDGIQMEGATEEAVKWIATSIYGGAADTTVASISQFILLMVLNPDIQKKAQDEIDMVIGRQRLPNLKDRPALPYVECVLKESVRWGTPVPMSIPHRLTQDDEYQGRTIPKGTLCIANIWAILHDEKIYTDPHTFSPERFEENANTELPLPPDPSMYMFGFGRRRCPGIHFANPSLWLPVASILASFHISRAIDEDGNEVNPTAVFESAPVRHPKPFKCRITPRHVGVESLIEKSAQRMY